MENNTIEMALMEPEERELVQFIIDAIPDQDRKGLTPDDILLVLDLMDDYLEEQGLLREDPETGEMEYLDGDVDETEQLNYVLGDEGGGTHDLCGADPAHPRCRVAIWHREGLL